jgi:peptide deformylase
MARLLRWPDARLRRAADPVRLDDRARAAWRTLLETMYGREGLLGLAAPQIGLPLRLAVADCSASRREPVRLANPELTWVSAETLRRPEASPSLPGVREWVERPAEIRVRFVSETGAIVETHFEGLWARAVQHQIDHLEGLTFLDRLSPLRRQRLVARARRARRAGGGRR